MELNCSSGLHCGKKEEKIKIKTNKVNDLVEIIYLLFKSSHCMTSVYKEKSGPLQNLCQSSLCIKSIVNNHHGFLS